MPLFSIVIPVYNVEPYLSDCLDSVLSQAFDDYEIVLVNDGSTDSSGEMCRQFCSDHPSNTKLVEQENKGLLLARRAGFAQTSGQIVLSLDSDDKLRSDALEVISSTFSRQSVDVVCFEGSRSARFKLNGGPLFPFAQCFYGDNRALVLQKLCQDFRFNSIWSKAIARNVLDVETDYSVFKGLSFGEDLVQIVSIFDAAASFAYIPDTLYYYRPNPHSLIQRFNPKNYKDMARSRERLLGFASKWEREYPGTEMVQSASSVSLWITALLVQQAASSLSDDELTAFLEDVRSSTLFTEAYGFQGARQSLRPDIRFVVERLNAHGFKSIKGIARVKNRLLGATRY